MIFILNYISLYTFLLFSRNSPMSIARSGSLPIQSVSKVANCSLPKLSLMNYLTNASSLSCAIVSPANVDNFCDMFNSLKSSSL